MNLPNLFYVLLAWLQPENSFLVNVCVGIEQFGYGFGFLGFMLFMLMFVEKSESKTAHYALMTGFMAMGMMYPMMVSGWIQEQIGYTNFFIWATLATIPGLILIKFLNIDPEFGKKQAAE